MIEVKNISFKYAGQKDLVFDDFSLELKQDNIYGLLGKNGTGKSTLLYLISGLLRAKKGTVRFDGVETKLRKPETLQEIFIVPEEFDLPSMSLEQYVKINHLSILCSVLRCWRLVCRISNSRQTSSSMPSRWDRRKRYSWPSLWLPIQK